MRILFAGQNFHVTGGSDRVLIDEYQLLERLGYDVAVLAAASTRNLRTPWSLYFPEAADLTKRSPFDAARYLRNRAAGAAMERIVDAFRPNVIHCHIYYGKLTASILKPAKRSGAKLVQTLHEYKLVCPAYTLYRDGMICESCRSGTFHNALLMNCKKNVLRSAISTLEAYVSSFLGDVDAFDHFIAVSKFQRMKLVELGIPAGKITTIYNPVEVPEIRPTTEGSYFLYAGRLEQEKGIDVLLDAFERMPGVQLLIVGDGSERHRAESRCAEKKMLNVKFKQFCDKSELENLISGSIATIAPSIWYETFGLSAAESLARGKPVIASAIGGLPEVCSSDDSFLIAPGSADELCTAVRTLDKDRSRARRMGLAGRKNMHRFSPQIHAQSLLRLYAAL